MSWEKEKKMWQNKERKKGGEECIVKLGDNWKDDDEGEKKERKWETE